ncbi:hypothetical protein [Methanocella arvoryzae]|uniref:DUF3821 domain-containing protein n=1 Tax=Methanocella arvoryzae (strain DSM 22066 / NBRC 105507 / MRE50) TaxID=351160 RepID=Q0W858_METAR|nr:hypothetical protein [Methanocella arvoryzae]CAJ35435.1 hypothetical protein LRC488 [Methanocella arvoryzae MRE50]
MHKKTVLTLLISLVITIAAFVVPAYAQTVSPEPVPAQVNLGNISGAVVTLYYYDEAAGGKGEMVELPDNPQYVQWDEQAAAPGTYTFTRVPEGKYYIEAVHNNNSWFAIATVDKGTTTANVAIPPRNWTDTPTIAPSATAAVTPLPTATPSATATPASPPTPAPGMGIEAALAGIGLISVYLLRKK